MRKHILFILALALVLALVGVLSLLGNTVGVQPLPKPKEPPVYCALPQPQFSEDQCTINQTIPGYQPQSGTADGQPLFLPMYPGSSICRVYYVDGLTNGTVTLCPVQELDRHD